MANYNWDNSGMLDNMQNMGMKRYKLLTGEGYGKYIARHVVDQEGEWVKWEDVKKYLGVEEPPVANDEKPFQQRFSEDYVDYLFERHLVEIWGEELEICGWSQGYLPDALKAMDPGAYDAERAKFIEDNFDDFVTISQRIRYCFYAWKDASKFDPEDYRQFQNRV